MGPLNNTKLSNMFDIRLLSSISDAVYHTKGNYLNQKLLDKLSIQ